MKQINVILESPTVIEKKLVDKNRGKQVINRADDKVFLESHAYLLSVNRNLGAAAAAFGIWLMTLVNNNQERILPALLILGGGFWMFYSLYARKNYKIFKLDRLTGTVTYPDSYFRKPLKGKFKNLSVVIAVSGEIDGYVDREYLKFVNTFRPRKVSLLYTFYGLNPYKDWSFYVWYMDRNRPLPPGTAFDPYREKDFERRKKLGFPRPLYPSNIATPEATEQQQKERKLIGGW